ncbi:5-formyltetrahydrofolate cyclo-ligase [Alkalicoccobacillus murimartini]|uniref:5-formyltetrahydrofolate cyclo-ligase n=1 Tax=Alkalicoccobacillus murimartini TaxID=171685 RepID=A0ABT9YDH4_9BACI|nr:5-formyltetrahydrofolate cyclo-ligase [Alkalicoccobacillus murimartini]MDQ0205591.1 5-formyltetrahydrofolate cyclo-ligase [Alkalicoccobacillus murimartini]
MKSEKQRIRSAVLNKLSTLSMEDHQQLSELIAHTLYQQPYWKKARTVALTVSRMPEVDTEPIIDRAWQEGKKVVLPRINKETREMRFYEVDTTQQLEETIFQLREPIPSLTIHRLPSEIDLMIVPGVAFTDEGHRLGLGGGYYDRYLPYFEGTTVSLLFPEQHIDSIPIEAHDSLIHHLVSTMGVLK